MCVLLDIFDFEIYLQNEWMNEYADAYLSLSLRVCVSIKREEVREKSYFCDFFTLFEVNYSYVIHGAGFCVLLFVTHITLTHTQAKTHVWHSCGTKYAHKHLARIEARFIVWKFVDLSNERAGGNGKQKCQNPAHEPSNPTKWHCHLVLMMNLF